MDLNLQPTGLWVNTLTTHHFVGSDQKLAIIQRNKIHRALYDKSKKYQLLMAAGFLTCKQVLLSRQYYSTSCFEKTASSMKCHKSQLYSHKISRKWHSEFISDTYTAVVQSVRCNICNFIHKLHKLFEKIYINHIKKSKNLHSFQSVSQPARLSRYTITNYN